MELTHAVLVLAVSLVVSAALVAAAVVTAGRRLVGAVNGLSGLYPTGVRPEVDYPVFDEALAKLHLEQAEEIQYGGEMTLEYEPLKVEF